MSGARLRKIRYWPPQPRFRCWNCGRFIPFLAQGNHRFHCERCRRSGERVKGMDYCISYGVRKSELIDHARTYAPTP